MFVFISINIVYIDCITYCLCVMNTFDGSGDTVELFRILYK